MDGGLILHPFKIQNLNNLQAEICDNDTYGAFHTSIIPAHYTASTCIMHSFYNILG